MRTGRFAWIGGGRQRTSTTHVDNAVHGLMLAATALAAAGETAWRVLPLPGRPPLTRLAVWVAGLEATIDITRAREELGYAPITTIDQGLAQLGRS